MSEKTEDPRGIAAEWVDIDMLSPWDQNPRKNDGAIQLVVDSIQRFGFGAPILARAEDAQIIAGHTRVKAARQLGLDKVPVRFLNLTKDEAEKLAIADNKLVEIADWDEAFLAQMIQDMPDEDWGSLGFSDAELKKLIGDVEADIDEEDFIENLEYRVIVDVPDEAAQTELMQKLETEGYKCQPLIS